MNCSDSGCAHRLYDEKADAKTTKETVIEWENAKMTTTDKTVKEDEKNG